MTEAFSRFAQRTVVDGLLSIGVDADRRGLAGAIVGCQLPPLRAQRTHRIEHRRAPLARPLRRALNKDSGEILFVAHGKNRPKHDHNNCQRQPLGSH